MAFQFKAYLESRARRSRTNNEQDVRAILEQPWPRNASSLRSVSRLSRVAFYRNREGGGVAADWKRTTTSSQLRRLRAAGSNHLYTQVQRNLVAQRESRRWSIHPCSEPAILTDQNRFEFRFALCACTAAQCKRRRADAFTTDGRDRPPRDWRSHGQYAGAVSGRSGHRLSPTSSTIQEASTIVLRCRLD